MHQLLVSCDGRNHNMIWNLFRLDLICRHTIARSLCSGVDYTRPTLALNMNARIRIISIAFATIECKTMADGGVDCRIDDSK